MIFKLIANSALRTRQAVASTIYRPIAFLAILAFIGCGNTISDGLNKFPVTGLVLVDGTPAAGVVVRFFKDGKPGQANADTPLAVTKADGTFEMSTNGDGDGAVPGQYRVTFFWRTGNSPGSTDQLGGRYAKLDKSEVTVNVVEGPNELEPFQLQKPVSGSNAESANPAAKAPVPNAPPKGQ